MGRGALIEKHHVADRTLAWERSFDLQKDEELVLGADISETEAGSKPERSSP